MKTQTDMHQKNNVMKSHRPANRRDVWTQVELWEAPSIWTDSLESEFCFFFSSKCVAFGFPEYQKKILKEVETINLIPKSQTDINQVISSV